MRWWLLMDLRLLYPRLRHSLLHSWRRRRERRRIHPHGRHRRRRRINDLQVRDRLALDCPYPQMCAGRWYESYRTRQSLGHSTLRLVAVCAWAVIPSCNVNVWPATTSTTLPCKTALDSLSVTRTVMPVKSAILANVVAAFQRHDRRVVSSE